MKKKSLILCLVLLFILFFIFQIIRLNWWARAENPVLGWDQSWHLMISINKYNDLTNYKHNTSSIEEAYPIFKFANNYYPPFFYIMTLPFYFVFGTGYSSALLTNSFFLVVLVVSSFFIGKNIKDEKTGLLFSFISMTIPIYNKMILHYLIDYAFAAMVALGYMFYLYSDNFNHKTYSMLFGLVFGLGMLTKWSYPVYFGILILFSLGKLDKTKIINLSLASLIVLIIIFPWYFPRLATLPQQLSVYAGNQEGHPIFNTLPGLTYYLKEIISGFSLVYFLLFMLCLFYVHKTKNEIYNIFFIYAIFTLLTIKVSRYIMPICVFMTAILVEGLSNLSVKLKQAKFNRYKIDNLIVGFILLAGFFSLFSLSFPEKMNSSIDINKVLSSIEEQNYTVCIIAESDDFNDVNIPYYAIRNKYPVRYMIGNGCNPLAFDYAIVGPIETSWRSNNFKYSEIALINNFDRFEIINIIHNITIYKKKLN